MKKYTRKLSHQNWLQTDAYIELPNRYHIDEMAFSVDVG
jgi:hypothetical protein